MDAIMVANEIERFIQDIKYDVSKGSFFLAQAVAGLIKRILNDSQWKSESEIKEAIIKMNKRLTSFFPYEPPLNNITLKFLKDFEDEYTESTTEGEYDSKESRGPRRPSLNLTNKTPIKDVALNVMNKLMTNIENSREKMARQSTSFIRPDEVILTIGCSRTVELFLKRAARKWPITVWAVFTTHCDVTNMVNSLNSTNITAYAIPDYQAFDMMPLISKVILGAHTVTSDRGLKCIRGTMNTVLAAKFHSVPVIACAANFKFSDTPLISLDMDAANVFLSPEDIIPFTSCRRSEVEVDNEVFDFIPDTFVMTIVTDA